jgi:hypothetical protein
MELTKEGEKGVLQVVIMEGLPPGRQEYLTHLFSALDVEVVNIGAVGHVEYDRKIQGIEYDQVSLDELSEKQAECLMDVFKLPVVSFPRHEGHSRGKGKKYKDWERKW